MGVDRVDYLGEVSTKTADLITSKLVINSTISTPGARFMGIDIKDFYLNSGLPQYECARVHLTQLPKEIIDQYNLMEIAVNGSVCIKVRKSMYGLPHAGKVASDNLIPHLAAHGYHQSKCTLGLFKHETRPVWFIRVVDDFGVKCIGKENAEHLHDALRRKCAITEDWEGKAFCRLQLQWNYDKGYVDVVIPDYIKEALTEFRFIQTKTEHSPHKWTHTSREHQGEPISDADRKHTLRVVGKLLHCGRAVNNTMLAALSSIAFRQAHGTEETLEAVTRLLNYAATHPNATIRFHASDMALHIHADASYLSEPKAKSRAANYIYLSDHPNKTKPEDNPPLNVALHVVTNIIKPVVSSSSKAEVGAAYQGEQEGCPIRTALDSLDHPQPPTSIITDNEVCHGILNDTINQKRSKAIDMRFYWLQDRIEQGLCSIRWRLGTDNLADYPSEHHAPAHHWRMRPIYLHPQDD